MWSNPCILAKSSLTFSKPARLNIVRLQPFGMWCHLVLWMVIKFLPISTFSMDASGTSKTYTKNWYSLPWELQISYWTFSFPFVCLFSNSGSSHRLPWGTPAAHLSSFRRYHDSHPWSHAKQSQWHGKHCSMIPRLCNSGTCMQKRKTNLTHCGNRWWSCKWGKS